MLKKIKILGDKTIFDEGTHYVIPRYQRAFAWEDKEIVQLIDDINDINDINLSENYYIGSLIVSKVENKQEMYEVVDGQQRLTTLFLLLQYLVSKGKLSGEIGQTLTFDCRYRSKYTFDNIQGIIQGIQAKEKFLVGYEENVDQSICNGLKVIHQKFSSDEKLNLDDFISRLRRVILYRIKVPEHTDLNRYFEIMNTRGEQLEQHDIIKTRLMSFLSDRGEQEIFSKIWNACSDMTGYVQMHFSRRERELIFDKGWSRRPASEWSYYEELKNSSASENSEIISDIIQSTFKVDDVDGMLGDDTHIRFESIIDFPYFLLHALRVFVKLHYKDLETCLGVQLDDKRLIDDFEKILSNECIKKNQDDFSKKFIIHLLQMRYLFDKFIVKREFTGEDKDGEWSLKELHTSGQDSKKKAYYSNTELKSDNERQKKYAPRTKECLMIQSALRVSYTSPKVMHWITDILFWLFNNMSKNKEIPKLVEVGECIAARAVESNFLTKENYKLGVTTPHIVFNFLDYLLWKANKEKYSDFEFEFRNSVEHWYPQNPSDGTFDLWSDKDTFGNLCIISRSVNSKFSNLSPESKMKSYERIVNRGSLKLRIMGEVIKKGSNAEWIKSECTNHENEMIRILKEKSGHILGNK